MALRLITKLQNGLESNANHSHSILLEKKNRYRKIDEIALL